jgi:hypothetical protein
VPLVLAAPEVGGGSSMMTPGVVLVVTPGVVVLAPGVVALRPGVVVPRPGVAELRLGVVVSVTEPGRGARVLFGTVGRPGPRMALLAPLVALPVPLPMPLDTWPRTVVERTASGSTQLRRFRFSMRNLLFNEGVAAKAIPPRHAGT